MRVFMTASLLQVCNLIFTDMQFFQMGHDPQNGAHLLVEFSQERGQNHTLIK